MSEEILIGNEYRISDASDTKIKVTDSKGITLYYDKKKLAKEFDKFFNFVLEKEESERKIE